MRPALADGAGRVTVSSGCGRSYVVGAILVFSRGDYPTL